MTLLFKIITFIHLRCFFTAVQNHHDKLSVRQNLVYYRLSYDQPFLFVFITFGVFKFLVSFNPFSVMKNSKIADMNILMNIQKKIFFRSKFQSFINFNISNNQLELKILFRFFFQELKYVIKLKNKAIFKQKLSSVMSAKIVLKKSKFFCDILHDQAISLIFIERGNPIKSRQNSVYEIS